MDPANYSKLENGKTDITLKKLETIANYLKLPIQSFLTSNNSQNISVTHSDHSPIQNAETINNTDPFLADTLKEAISALIKVLGVIKK
jgi:transcriptional regulator with XRE-family HTH domain